MKKATKQKIMVLFIVLTFSLSSIAYFMIGIVKEEEFTPLEKFVVDGELKQTVEYEYLRRGFTILKLYYLQPSQEIDRLPDTFRTNTNEIQLIVEKIKLNETNIDEYVKIIGPNDEEEINNVTMGKIYDSLCKTLFDPPAIECGLINITS